MGEIWISAASTALTGARRFISSSAEQNEKARQLKRRLTESLHYDCEQWWLAKVEEMEKAAVIGNSRQLIKLIQESSPVRLAVTLAKIW